MPCGLARALAGLLLVGLVGAVMLRLLERQLVYIPSRLPADAPPPPLEHGRVEDVTLEAADGVRLHAWYVASRRPARPTPVLLHFHGNAGNILDRAEHADAFAARGLDVLLLSYRGYGKSGGTPSETGLYRDADAAYDYLVEVRGVPPERIVAYGQSLGSAVAVDLAARRPAGGLIVESGFTSAPELGRRLYPFLPEFVFRWMAHRFASVEKIARVRAPVLVVHGLQDEIVPVEMGRRLYETARAPKEWYELPGAGHNDTWSVGGDAYYERLATFARRVAGGETAGR